MDILQKITRLREERHWTEYQLAERSGLPQSTVSSWYRKGMLPSLSSLEKISVSFGITLSQLLANDNDTTVSLTVQQKDMLDNWNKLSEVQRKHLLAFLKNM